MIIFLLRMIIHYCASCAKVDCKPLESIMYKDTTLSSMNLNFKNMMENFVKKNKRIKNKINLLQKFTKKENCNIEKEKQIMHASYDVSLKIALRIKKVFLMN